VLQLEDALCRRQTYRGAGGSELVSLAVTRSASMHFALRAALQLRKTAILPFCHSIHSYGYESRSRAARDKFDSSPSLAIV
jgi:hypothetical protein